jgi:Domain of unknown function (DUF4214)
VVARRRGFEGNGPAGAWIQSRSRFRWSPRPADTDGLNGWVDRLHHGATDEQVLAAIVGSQEYANRS